MNVGSHFDPARSVFLAPRKGVYSFSFNVVKVYNRQTVQASQIIHSSTHTEPHESCFINISSLLNIFGNI